MTEPVYILIRTSNRPLFFARMMKTIKQQTYKNVVTIVHTDDPRDEYVTGDVIIRGTAYTSKYGDGTYNLYNNTLLKAIPEDKPGWFHFIDDDDEYASPDVIERLVAASKQNYINVAKVERVMRDGKVIYPRHFGNQKSYQTECFFLHTDHRLKARWWGNKGGDHHYSRQLTRLLPINWIEDILICKAQESKGHGRKLDAGGKNHRREYDAEKEVAALYIKHCGKIKIGTIELMKCKDAEVLEKKGIIKVTYKSDYAERMRPPEILNIR